MSAAHPQNLSHLEYSLPGIMHYLQKETTKNERDRVQWELEKGELKSNITKLEGENKSLHEEVSRLKAELGHVNNSKNTKVNKAEVSKIKFKEVDVNPLAHAREKLQSQIKEIGVLLNATPVDLSKLQLDSDRAYYSTYPGLSQQDESTAESSLNSNQVAQPKEAVKITNSSPIQKKETISTFEKPKADPAPEFKPETHDVDESDAETVTGETEEEIEPPQQQQQQQNNHKGIEKFLLPHFATITSLASNGKELLAASEGGVIKYWSIQDILNSKGALESSKSYRADSELIKFVKWIDKDHFVTVSGNIVRFFDKNSTQPPSVKYNINSVKSVDANNSHIAHVANDGSLTISNLTYSPHIKYEKVKDRTEKCDFVAFDTKNEHELITVKQGGVVEVINLETKKKVTPILSINFADKTITNFTVEEKLWCFELNKNEVILYNTSSKSITFQQKYEVEIAKVQVSPKHIVIFLTDGDIKVYETKNSKSEIFKDYNIYKLFFTDHSNLTKEDKVTLKNSLKTGILVFNDYVFGGCEDSLIRGFKI